MVACDFCGAQGPHRVLLSDVKGSQHDLVECSCGLRFYDPRRTEQDVLSWIATHGQEEANCLWETGRLIRTPGLPPDEQKAALAFRAQDQYRQVCYRTNRPISTTVYEVGASIGWFLQGCIAAGADAAHSGGCDVNPWATALGREKLGLHLDSGPFSQVTPPCIPYGVILANDYIEHTYTPHADLRKMRLLTVAGGGLFLKTFVDDLDEPLGRSMLDPPWHAHHFTRSTLRRAVEHSGWSIAWWEEEPAFAQVTLHAVAV